MGAFPLLAEETEKLDRFGTGSAEPVQDAGVELGRFARCEHQIVVSES